MAEVYLAHQAGMGGFEKLVVFKRLADRFLDNETYVHSFLREARVAAAMGHPNIVTTTDVGQDDRSPYLVMEYLSGEPLSFLMRSLGKQRQRMPLQHLCRIAASVAAALDYAHNLTFPDGTRSAVVHCDVTPSNIMCCYGGDVKLLDFGIARILAEEHTQTGQLHGKLGYVAPEQVRGSNITPRTDLFQLGVVLWEMITMQRLFEGDSDASRLHAILHQPIAPPGAIAQGVPTELDAIVMWCLQRDPASRCPSAHVLAQRLISASLTPSDDRDFGRWMQTTFVDRRAWRSGLERRVRGVPSDGPSGLIRERIITSSVPSVSRSVVPPPRSAPIAAPTATRPTLQWLGAVVVLVSAVGIAVLTSLVLLTIWTAPTGPQDPAAAVQAEDGGLSPTPGALVAEPPPAPEPPTRAEAVAAPLTHTPPKPPPVAVETPTAPPRVEDASLPEGDEPAPDDVEQEPTTPAPTIEKISDNLDPWASDTPQ
ncbi:MAG: protein kinase [Myxococcales bacterium]|nr:protein kinase [Myxococcales bacterium]